MRVSCEMATAAGRVDAVGKTKDRKYVFEFKLNASADIALAQIKDKHYQQKYLDDGRELVIVAVAFDN